MKKLLIAGLSVVSIYSSTLKAEYYNHVNVNFYTQDDACWCSIANIEMMSDWIANQNSSSKQEQKVLAERYGVGEFTETDNDKGYDCIRDNGWVANGLGIGDVAQSLNDEVKTYKGISGYSFRDVPAYSNSLPAEIARHIAHNKPIILLAKTRYRSSSKPDRNKGHYFVIDAVYSENGTEAEMKSAYGTSGSVNVDGYYVNDPSYGGVGTSGVKSISPSTYVSKNELTNNIAATISSNKHTFVKY